MCVLVHSALLGSLTLGLHLQASRGGGDSVGRAQRQSHWAGRRSPSPLGPAPLMFPAPLKGAPFLGPLQSPHPDRGKAGPPS